VWLIFLDCLIYAVLQIDYDEIVVIGRVPCVEPPPPPPTCLPPVMPLEGGGGRYSSIHTSEAAKTKIFIHVYMHINLDISVLIGIFKVLCKRAYSKVFEK
jgi:hypothetical protein